MPIKLPKGFARRKSSGNVLDEVENGQESSFRVFERPGGGTKSFEGGMMLKNAAAGRYYNNRPATAESDNLFAGIEKPLPNNRGSGGTHHSTSTAGVYDSSSSARYSSSSTLPSSTDGAAHNDHSKTFHDIPPAPMAESPSLFSLRAAGRTFSFGTKPSRFSTPPQTQQQQTQPQYQPQYQPQVQHQYQQSESPAQARDRAMTASSASTATATPPRLLDSDFQVSGTDDDNFTSMFENFGKRKSAIQLRPLDSDDIQSKALPIPPQDERPAPINVDRSQPVEPSPYSGNSETSHDGLISDRNARISRKSLAPSQSNHNSNIATSPVSINSESSGPSTAFIDDADAAIVRQSLLLSSSKPNPPAVSNPRHESVDEDTPLFNNDDITSNARLASQYEQEVSSRPSVQNKVMTPAQFERYRQQRELTRKYSNASKSDSSGENDYDEDEDEAEKSREAAKQRRKQEAHLSVYRQQMMKVIGEQAPAVNSLQPPSLSRLTVDQTSVSTPNLSSRMSTLGLPVVGRQDGSKSSDGEDDDDVPLGILAAHGFPNKLRPPTRLSVSTSNPNLRGSVAPGSVSGESGRVRDSLPVFARNLPSDPYYGAGLINGPPREGLAMGGGNPAYGPGSSGSLHPGGLVGVIASEERARAMRRGSPNAQTAGIPRPYSMANMGQMGSGAPPGMSQQPSPGELAQMQINQQMTEMMQVQVQMMQQMMQMQGQQGQINPGLMPPPGQFLNPGGRPMSTASSYNNMAGQDQRTLSLLDPATMSRWNLNRPASIHPDATGRPGTPHDVHVYAPSIAPSERSNVGMASRYRPVSTIGQDPHMARSSTFTSTLKPWNNENQRSGSMTPPASSQASNRKSTSMATVTVRAVGAQGRHSPAARAGDDEDEDEGWADMKKKREKKKSSWKMKKETSALGDLLHMVH